MATIIRHPDVEDYIVELTLREIKSREQGIIDLYESNRLILLKNFRMPINMEVLQQISGNLSKVDDPKLQTQLKKMTSAKFVDGLKKGIESKENNADSGNFETDEKIRRAVYDVLCDGDRDLFDRVSTELKTAHEVALELFSICFPTYSYFNLIPSVRLTPTLFENLHWDNHQIQDDFQQVRIFCNLDQRPRLWHTSHNFVTYAESLYREHQLERFAGSDPNDLNNYICGAILGGTANACKDTLPRHSIAFEPGEVWFGESRMISHQIFYGERAMVYMFLVRPGCMLNPERRFNRQLENLHARMAG